MRLCALRAIKELLSHHFINEFDFLFPVITRFLPEDPEAILGFQDLLGVFLTQLESMPERSVKYLNFLMDFAKLFGRGLETGVVSSILNTLTDQLLKFDRNALILFGLLGPHADSCVVAKLISLVPSSLAVFIEQYPSHRELVSMEKLAITPPFQAFPITKPVAFNIVSNPTFKNGIGIPTSSSMADLVSAGCLVSPELNEVLELLIVALRPHGTAAMTFWEWIICQIENNSRHLCDFVVVFIVTFKELISPSQIVRFWEVILNSPVFDERLNFLDDQPQYAVVDQLRAFAFQAALEKGSLQLDQVISLFCKKPKLVVDLFDRLLIGFEQISVQERMEKSLIRIMSAVTLYFQTIHINCDDSNRRLINGTRSNIFLFLHRILEDQEIASVWMNDPVFRPSFFSLVFEPAVRSLVLIELKLFLVSGKSTEKAIIAVGNTITAIFDVAFSRIGDAGYLELLADLLGSLNEVLAQKSDLPAVFAPILTMIVDRLPQLPANTDGDRFLVEAIHFFVAICGRDQIPLSQLEALATAVQCVSCNKPSMAVLQKFIQLLAGIQLSSISSTFIITQPLALSPLVRLVLPSSHLVFVLDFLRRLFEFSQQNCITAAHVAFDSFLLDLMNTHKYDDQFPEAVFGIILDIVSQIGAIASSARVVQQFISLLCPIENKSVSPHEVLFLQRLNQIIKQAATAPPIWIPLSPSLQSPSIIIRDFDGQKLGSSFSLVLWIYLDHGTTSGNIPILEISDGKWRAFHIFINAEFVVVMCEDEANE
jgi:hypothetical protein